LLLKDPNFEYEKIENLIKFNSSSKDNLFILDEIKKQLEIRFSINRSGLKSEKEIKEKWWKLINLFRKSEPKPKWRQTELDKYIDKVTSLSWISPKKTIKDTTKENINKLKDFKSILSWKEITDDWCFDLNESDLEKLKNIYKSKIDNIEFYKIKWLDEDKKNEFIKNFITFFIKNSVENWRWDVNKIAKIEEEYLEKRINMLIFLYNYWTFQFKSYNNKSRAREESLEQPFFDFLQKNLPLIWLVSNVDLHQMYNKYITVIDLIEAFDKIKKSLLEKNKTINENILNISNLYNKSKLSEMSIKTFVENYNDEEIDKHISNLKRIIEEIKNKYKI